MEILELGTEDYDRIFSLWAGAGVTTVLGVEEEGALVGVVVATHDGRKGWINRHAVAPEHRRRGHARRLLAAAEQALRAKGLRIIAALVEERNETSLAFFRREGYDLAKDVFYFSKRESDEV